MRLSISFFFAVGPVVFSNLVGAQDSANAEYATIPIDHNDASVGTYRNQYFVNEQYYSPGGPILLFDVGESYASTRAEQLLYNSSSYFTEFLKEFHAMGIVWEHRFYGASMPFGNYSTDPDPEHMKYLTTDQALADIPYFAKNFTRRNFSDVDLTPQGTPWVMIGRSYPGMRAVLSRKEYPDTFFAAWGSSAIAEARTDFSSYFNQVYRGMIANGHGNCVKDTQVAIKYIDDQLSNNETAATIKQKLFGPGAEINDNGDIAYFLSYIFLSFQENGVEGSVGEFCLYLETDPSTKKVAGPEGLAPIYGIPWVVERFASWSGLIEPANSLRETNCGGVDASQPISCDLSKPYKSYMALSWVWQYCTEWGYFQSNNFGPEALSSKFLTLEFQQNFCYRNFPTAHKAGVLPVHPRADAFNVEHGGFNMRPSNVYWSVGQWDPWRALTPFSTEDFAPKGVNITSEIPDCGVETSQDELFGYILENETHGKDLDTTDNEQSRHSRDLFRRALRKWLPCFKPKSSILQPPSIPNPPVTIP